MKDKSLIEIAYATPHKQLILEHEVEAGSLAREAVRSCGIDQHFPEIDLEVCDIGVYGKAVADDYQLNDGDRIEIYRPLIADPKEVRRQRAARGLKMKKGGGALNPD
jgi:putative ubiquitin-RnfH superfamily antitoxin RatB of RatAB toxin-antitoxin module